MNDRELAISILQQARDKLGERLTERIIEAQDEINDDAQGASYLSEIEAIYEQLASRLAHVNAMLSNLPPELSAPVEQTANEIVYADLATSTTPFEVESASSGTVLALPAPPSTELTIVQPEFTLSMVIAHVRAGELDQASHAISHFFDIKPSLARRAASSFSRTMAEHPELGQRVAELGNMLSVLEEHAAAGLVSRCFEFSPTEALAIVRELRARSPRLTDAR